MKYWVFDLDGTLIDSHGTYFQSLEHVLRHFGTDLSEQDQKEILSISVKNRPEFFERKVGKPASSMAMALLDQRLREDHLRVSPFAGVIELLDTLKARQAGVALWTARDLDSAVQVLEHLGLHHYFSLCVGSTCISKCKPHPEGLLKVAEHFRCMPADLAMVGDHENDLLAAQACGAKAIQAMWHSPGKTLPSQHAYRSFKDILGPEGLRDWVNKNK